MHPPCATHTLALLGALSAHIPTALALEALCMFQRERSSSEDLEDANGSNAKPMAPTSGESGSSVCIMFITITNTLAMHASAAEELLQGLLEIKDTHRP